MLLKEKRNYSSVIFKNTIFFITLVFTLAILYRHQILNGFSILSGDRYDAVISTSILEHWFNTFRGYASWTEMNYFYPYTKTIAQTDAYLLMGIFYSPIRALGLDPFLSAEITGMLIKVFGFISMFVLARIAFKFSFGWSLIISVLFTLSNSNTVHMSRLQLASVAFVPLMILLLWNSLEDLIQLNLKKSILYGTASGLYYGFLAMTCFYIAWYFVFFTFIFIVVLFILNMRNIKKFIVHNYKNIAKYSSFVSLAYAAGIAPFVYTFYEKSKEVGVRSYESVFQHTVPLENILQVGNENIFLGKIYNYFLSYVSKNYIPNGEYYNCGFPFILFIIFAFATIYFFKKYRTVPSIINHVLLSFAISTVIVLLLVLKIINFSFWIYVYNYFPGAQALNAVETIMIFLVIPVLLVAIKYLDELKLPLIALFLIPFVLILSELNTPYLNLNRTEQLNALQIDMPPQECKVFYVTGLSYQDKIEQFPDWINNLYAHNVMAIFIAQKTHLPTINGVASFNPPDWNFGFPNNDDYETRINDYIDKHNIKDVCRLDLNTKAWNIEKND